MPSKKKSLKKNSPINEPAEKSPMEKSSDESPVPARSNKKCKCLQDPEDERFYCFKLQHGRWVQDSGISFETQEDCEADCCEV